MHANTYQQPDSNAKVSAAKRSEEALFESEAKLHSAKPHCSSVSPVRVSQFLFNVDKMKEQANTAAANRPEQQAEASKARTAD